MSKKTSLVSIARAALCAALITISSFVTFPINAVPVTLQTFSVCAVAGLLGLKWGLASVSVYVMLGALGLPVFSGFGGGLGVLLGAGGGYIWGFFLIALIVGAVSDKFGAGFFKMATAMLLGLLLCYTAGTLWYSMVYTKGDGIASILATCFFPFVLPDIVKIIAAILVSKIKKHIHKR